MPKHPLAQLKNIGDKTAAWLEDAGIHTAEDLHRLGALETWRRVREVHPEISLVGLYALQGAVLDIHWNALPADMKADLRAAVEDVL